MRESQDSESHDHDAHAGHDHEAQAGHDHDAQAGHDHDAQAGHDHDAQAGHDHDAQAGHDHDAHVGHDHDAHAGHDHEAHAGHDAHADHDHDAHAGHDHSGHDHHHDHAHDLRGASKRSLIIALCLISTYMVAEVIGGYLSGSLALIADAGHMLTDAAAIAMALVAMWIAEKAASVEHTFGYYRTEVLAALANLFSLWLIAGWIIFEAYHRLFVEEVEVIGWPVFIVGFGGLLINIAAAWVLHKSSEHSVNVEGALQHVIADALGSIAVIVAGAIIIITDQLGNPLHIVDPILSAVIALLIVYNTRKLIVRVMKVLLEGVPDHIDVYKLCHDIEEQPGVTIIHDVHVWTITSGSEAFTAHVLVDPTYEDSDDALLTNIKRIIHEDYGISHATIQLERSAIECKEDHHVDHLYQQARSSA